MPAEKALDIDGIHVVGAREHNLKNISVFIPRNKITVITGLSGSGKSSLAFDTIYAEGQRRYLESLSVYARYFIDQLKRPDVEEIWGLSPSICINQRAISNNPRSTVGTVTEMYDYLRLLYAKVGEVFCPTHRIPLKSRTMGEIMEEVLNRPEKEACLLLSPVARGKKGEFQKEFRSFLAAGFDKARIDGEWKDLHRIYRLVKKESHYIDLLIDRLPLERKNEERIRKAVERALSMSGGYLKLDTTKGTEIMYSLHYACPYCGYSAVDPEPGLFSFNSPKGACRHCNGTGLKYVDEDLEEEDKEVCPLCLGDRLCREALQVKVQGMNIAKAASLSSEKLSQFLRSLKLKKSKQLIADKIIEPILFHIDFLKALGTGYLSFNRSVSSLSGGEAQRIRLVSQLSSPLIGVLYVLDEPSIGLHPKDHGKILSVLKTIRDRGNTIIMVEHDEESIRQADQVIDLGPGAGDHGGAITAMGTVKQIEKDKNSLTGAYLSRRETIPRLPSLYSQENPVLALTGAKEHNLKNIDVSIPLGCLVGISGVSGSGKSTLIKDTLYPVLLNHLNGGEKKKLTGAYKDIKGLEPIQKALQINQRPIGRTPRSVPATYTGVFQMIRVLFSQLPAARMKGHKPGHFSFNVSGGRCEKCLGGGYIKMEMGFLPNVFALCSECQGHRYGPGILDIKYKGKNIFEVLDMTVSQALLFFQNHPYISSRLSFLEEVGLGYIRLGQSSTTLSGGEAQRIKLSRELAKNTKGHILYILDEPTTGLHFHDIKKLIELLRKLVRKSRTVVVIEHNLDVLKSCDYLIDLGPEGGEEGGYVVATGRPEEVAKAKKSHTGKYLKPFF